MIFQEGLHCPVYLLAFSWTVRIFGFGLVFNSQLAFVMFFQVLYGSVFRFGMCASSRSSNTIFNICTRVFQLKVHDMHLVMGSKAAWRYVSIYSLLNNEGNIRYRIRLLVLSCYIPCINKDNAYIINCNIKKMLCWLKMKTQEISKWTVIQCI